ncbi:MAG TPA: hypothetical protein VHW66_22190 [Stellaceae bacterium]|nr:hypothetical protein [Stellaceae bacterium]
MIADASPDPIARDVCKVLQAFGYSEVIGKKYFWKYLSDEAFSAICKKPGMSVRTMNRTLFSHFLRVIEAFELVSIWRARDLVGSCVASLNEERLVSAATLARSLIELAVTYSDAANYLRAAFDVIPWSNMADGLISPVVKDEHGNETNLEAFIERLMSGTRMESLRISDEMIQRNILTIMDKMDKKLRKQHGYEVKKHYELLCELAHPNTLGFQRFLSKATPLSNGWENRLMEENSESERSIHIAHECLWALSFGAGSMDGVFGVFQDLKRNAHKNIGRPLPG